MMPPVLAKQCCGPARFSLDASEGKLRSFPGHHSLPHRESRGMLFSRMEIVVFGDSDWRAGGPPSTPPSSAARGSPSWDRTATRTSWSSRGPLRLRSTFWLILQSRPASGSADRPRRWSWTQSAHRCEVGLAVTLKAKLPQFTKGKMRVHFQQTPWDLFVCVVYTALIGSSIFALGIGN